ncbi:hypothetical protein QQZ08_005889 [Neonectria magnoliae]|uniref:Uncharacterized protein n=1 Tax=Neonectria magnoliae TaxID=2732573 RepID=A0ABR1I278_9HYPO
MPMKTGMWTFLRHIRQRGNSLSAYNPEDTTRQAELDDALKALVLKPVGDLFTVADPKVDEASFKTSRFEDLLGKREEDGFWGYACGDVIEAIAGLSDKTEAGHKLLCAGKGTHDSRDALKCLFGGCGTPSPYTELTYSWNYNWTVEFPSIAQWLVKLGDNVLTCVNCSFTISSLKFSGKIVVWSSQGSI